jgi:hypothetical protein
MVKLAPLASGMMLRNLPVELPGGAFWISVKAEIATLPFFSIVMAFESVKGSRSNPGRVVEGEGDALSVGVICRELDATELDTPTFGTEDGCDEADEAIGPCDDPELATVDVREVGGKDGGDGDDCPEATEEPDGRGKGEVEVLEPTEERCVPDNEALAIVLLARLADPEDDWPEERAALEATCAGLLELALGETGILRVLDNVEDD